MGIHEDILSRIKVKIGGIVLGPTFIQQYEMLPYLPGQYAKTYFYYKNDNDLEICIDVRDHRTDEGFITIEAARQTFLPVELSLDNTVIANWPQLTSANAGAIGRVNWHILPVVPCIVPVSNLSIID